MRHTLALLTLPCSLMAQTSAQALMNTADSLLHRLDLALSQDEGQEVPDLERLLALADVLDRNPGEGTFVKAAECRVWCLGIPPGQRGSARAYVALADQYRRGRGVPKDETFARELEQALCTKYDKRGPAWWAPLSDQRLIAALLETGRIYPKDRVAAAAWWFQAKDRNRALELCRDEMASTPGGSLEVVRCLVDAKELETARKFLKGMRPSQNHPALELAYLLTRADASTDALRLLTEAAEAGDTTASRQLAWAYRDGQGFGIKSQDGVAYLHHLRVCAQRKTPDVLLELGKVYWMGRWVSADPTQAAICFREAGTYGRPYLAEAYFLGRGVPRDHVKALELFRESYSEFPVVTEGLPQIGDRLAEMYGEGLGTPRDVALAARFLSRNWGWGDLPFSLDELLTRAAPVDSWIELGATLKARGRFGAAARVFQKAMELGSVQATAELGDLHAHDRRKRDDFRDDFKSDKVHGVELLKQAQRKGATKLWQPLGFHYKVMDVALNPEDVEDESEADPDPSADWQAKADRYLRGEGVVQDSVRALYYRLCAMRDAPGC